MEEKSSIDDTRFEKLKNLYSKGYNYHTLKFPNDQILEGIFDMSKVIKNYQIPDDLTGKTVLDIGPANGYFSIELSRRGARVHAIDRYDTLGFEEINELMSTKIKFSKMNISNLDESFGKFDLVFCSNVLQHSSDIAGNIQRIKSVTKEKAILCTQIIDNPQIKDVSFARYLGLKHSGPQGEIFNTYWLPNMKCFIEMALNAGFKRVEEISTHLVKAKTAKNNSLEGIIHCYV